jgi:hypothetical protein
MNLEQYAQIAEIIASIAVVASLIFVALEIRKNTRQPEIANRNALVDRFNAVYLQTNDLGLANLVAKGRESCSDLSAGEKISFGHYPGLFRRHIRYHLGFKGSRQWYEEFSRVRGFPPMLAVAHGEALEQP